MTPNYKMMERWGRFGSAHIFKIDLLLSQDLSACSCPCDLRYPPHSTHPVSDLPGIAGTECLPDSLRQVQGRFYFISYHVFGKSVGVLSPDRAVTSPPPSHLPTTDLICPPLCWGGILGRQTWPTKARYLSSTENCLQVSIRLILNTPHNQTFFT